MERLLKTLFSPQKSCWQVFWFCLFCCSVFCSAGSLNGLKGDPIFLVTIWLSRYTLYD